MTPLGPAGPVAGGAAELEAGLAGFVRENRLPGAAAAIVHEDDLAWSAAVGLADVAAGRAASPATLYRIASITKTFTGTAIMQLRDAGRLALDDPAVAFLPELRGVASPHAPIEALTIRRLLSHESGLAADPPGTDWAVSAYQGVAALNLARAGDLAVVLPPHAAHKYSNIGYQLLGEIVARVSGVCYPEYLQQAILGPLGLSATAFDPLAESLAGRRAAGYNWRALSDELDLAPATPPVWAEGGLWSCLGDMGRWISFQLRAYRDPEPGPPVPAVGEPWPAAGAPVLAAASLREMHQPRYLGDDQWMTAWGISWCADRRDDVIWIGHSGGLPGFTTTVCFDPREQVGAVVLMNGTTASAEIGIDLASIARRLILAQPRAVTAPAPMPAEFGPLLGLYARHDLGGWVLRLEWRDGKLSFVAPDATVWPLVPTGDPDVFALAPGSGLPGENATFRRRADGRVFSVFLIGSTWIRLDRVAESG